MQKLNADDRMQTIEPTRKPSCAIVTCARPALVYVDHPGRPHERVTPACDRHRKSIERIPETDSWPCVVVETAPSSMTDPSGDTESDTDRVVGR